MYSQASVCDGLYQYGLLQVSMSLLTAKCSLQTSHTSNFHQIFRPTDCDIAQYCTHIFMQGQFLEEIVGNALCEEMTPEHPSVPPVYVDDCVLG